MSEWMQRALRLAEKGRFAVSPNPMVGACIVKKGKLIAEGWHEAYGKDHAEAAALKKAGARAKGATLYVTLEPCSNWGKTPPCAATVIKSGVREVVIGSLDPNPENHAKGVAALKRAGLKVTSGVLASEVERQNEAFFKFIRTGLPFVTVKMAQSLDGKIATKSGCSRWISSPASRSFVQNLRAEQDAILVGKNTLLLDNPSLLPHLKNHKHPLGKPWRVALGIPPRNAKIFQGDSLTLLAVAGKEVRRASKSGNGALIVVREKKGRLDLRDLLKKLAELGAAKVLVEGGGELAWSLIREGLADKAFWIIVPKIIGGRNAKTSVEGEGVDQPSQAFGFKVSSIKESGQDWIFEGRFK